MGSSTSEQYSSSLISSYAEKELDSEEDDVDDQSQDYLKQLAKKVNVLGGVEYIHHFSRDPVSLTELLRVVSLPFLATVKSWQLVSYSYCQVIACSSTQTITRLLRMSHSCPSRSVWLPTNYKHKHDYVSYCIYKL